MKSINFKSSSTNILGLIDCKAVSLTKATMNTVNDENIEDTDEYLNIKERHELGKHFASIFLNLS